jgi:hypothetical protein
MKIQLIAPVLLFVIGHASASSGSPAILNKAVIAVELAERVHSEATSKCSVKRIEKRELLNWSHIETDMRELANAKTEPAVSRMLDVRRVLGLVRDVLREDLVFCSLPLDQSAAVASIGKAISSVDDAITDVDLSIFNRVVTLEWIAKQYRSSPCNK